MAPTKKPSILIVGGPTATIENTPPLLTTKSSPQNMDGRVHSGLRAQRLAADVDVMVEAYSGHPLEQDAAHLYGPPDCFVDENGNALPDGSRDGIPAYRARLRRDDGLFLLPYQALKTDGEAWDTKSVARSLSQGDYRQTFYPSPDRLIEEIDRFGLSNSGTNCLISSVADVTTIRLAPPGGFVHPASTPAEISGKDFFPYQPTRFANPPGAKVLAHITNTIQLHLATGRYDGAIWLEGSPFIEETTYWLNILIDTTVPICGNAAQRPHGALSSDGDRNLVDSVNYIRSRVWAGDDDRDRVGVVLVQDQRIYAARDVHKVAARPGGYRATGGTGGVVGVIEGENHATLEYLPTRRHTYLSSLRLPDLPRVVFGSRTAGSRVEQIEVTIKDESGMLREEAIPCVKFVKVGRFAETIHDSEDGEVEVDARVSRNLEHFPLAGFVLEGSCPYGQAYASINRALSAALFSGMPTVRVGRGTPEDYVPADDHLDGLSVPGSNLSAPKARILLMACLLKFGCAPVAADPHRPTPAERANTRVYLQDLAETFAAH